MSKSNIKTSHPVTEIKKQRSEIRLCAHCKNRGEGRVEKVGSICWNCYYDSKKPNFVAGSTGSPAYNDSNCLSAESEHRYSIPKQVTRGTIE